MAANGGWMVIDDCSIFFPSFLSLDRNSNVMFLMTTLSLVFKPSPLVRLILYFHVKALPTQSKTLLTEVLSRPHNTLPS